jgi:hypothetical protein
MKLPRRTFLHLTAGAATLPAVSRIAWAQAYPTRPRGQLESFASGSPFLAQSGRPKTSIRLPAFGQKRTYMLAWLRPHRS